MTTTVLLIGLTKSDRAAGYSSFSDGYRPGAAQHVVRLTIETAEPAPTPREWAEHVYEAMNAPFELTGPSALVRTEITRLNVLGVRMRTLSVGDTVTVAGDPAAGAGGVMLACEGAGWADVLNEIAPRYDDAGDGDAPVPASAAVRVPNPDDEGHAGMPLYEGAVGKAHEGLHPGSYLAYTEAGDAVRLVVHATEAVAEYDTGR